MYSDQNLFASSSNGHIFMQVFLALFLRFLLIFCAAETSPETREELT